MRNKLNITLILTGFTLLLFQQCAGVEFSQEQFSSSLQSPATESFRDFQPVMAVRGVGCISCHANVDSSVITDFGHQSSYFLGKGAQGISFKSGSIYGDHDSSWKSSKVKGSVLVPTTGKHLIDGKSQTLSDYLTGIEAQKNLSDRALVIEKTQVYIGAPSAETLFHRFNVSSPIEIKSLRNSPSSPVFSGIQLLREGYFKNSNEIICDGDVLVNGTLLLDNPVIRTSQGCRIHATGTIFLQGEIKYINISTDGLDRTNLQLVSARAVSMGVGTNHCETANYPGHYFTHASSYGSNPLKQRLTMWTAPGYFTRDAQMKGRSPAQESQLILSDAAMIPQGLEDASCFSNKRETHLERLLINAPQIHSRYRGAFRGVMIAELALASLGAFAFEFDPVFKEVPVLPVLEEADFLIVR